MAQFNPAPNPTQDPSYLGYSRPISPMEGNKAGGIALAGIGNAFEGALKGADTVVKSVIDSALYEQVDKQRESFTGSLEQVTGIPADKRVADIQPSGEQAGSITPRDIIPGATAQPLPSELQGLERTVSSLRDGAMAKNYPSAYYESRLDLIAKDMRNQFPGYRDYIDTKIASITGGNPANEYMKLLVAGYNQTLSSQKSEREKMVSYVQQNDKIPGAAAMMVGVQNGTISHPQLVQWAGKAKEITFKAEQQKAALDLIQGDVTLKKITADKNFNTIGDEVINHSMVTLFANTPQLEYGKIPGLITDIQTGKVNLGAQEGAQLSQSLNVFRANQFQNLKNIARQNGTLEVLGDEETNKRINAKLEGIDHIIKQVDSKDFGAAHRAANAVKNITTDTSLGLMNSNNITVQTWIRNQAALTSTGGANGASILFQSSVAKGLPSALQTVTQDQIAKIAAQPNKSKVFTIFQAIEDLKKAGVGVPDPANPKDPIKKSERAAYEVVTSIVDKIPDVNLNKDVVKNIVTGAYGPGNEKVIDKFAKDEVVNGVLVPGQHVLFDKMTKKAITDTVFDLSKDDRTHWTNFKGWAERSHAQIFGQDIRDLNDLGSNPAVKFVYNNKTQQLGYELNTKFFAQSGMTVGGKFIPTGNAQTGSNIQNKLVKQYSDKIAFINSGLANMAEIAKKEGKDPNEYIVNLLSAQNLDPSILNPGSQIVKAVQSSFGKNLTEAMASNLDLGYTFPKLDDLTGALVKHAAKDQIKGTANAAHVSEEWGNPFDPKFPDQHLTTIKTSSGIPLNVNKKAAEAFSGFIQDLEATGYKIDSVGSFNIRSKKFGGGVSQHSFGNAIDINEDRNPFLKGAKKAKTDLPENVSDLAAKWGLTWGGDWHSVKDSMHFEYTGKKGKPMKESLKLAEKK